MLGSQLAGCCRVQARDDGGSDQGCVSGDGAVEPDSRDVQEAKSTGPGNGLDIRGERKEVFKDSSQLSELFKWVDSRAIC